ncbi:MAG: L-lactate permease [Aggregatilineales bacterium]
MPTGFFDVILAIAPPLVVLVLMVGFSWGGSKAGPVGWIVALVISLLFFGAGAEVQFYAHIRSLILTADVVYIVFSALLLYMVVDQAGALKVIADWFTALTEDDVLQVLLIGWVFTSFLQGVGGFGVPVAIAAPLLVGLGLSPLKAILVPSLGHAWAVTFGSLGSSFITMVGVTGLDGAYLAPPTAVILGICAIVCGVLAAHVYAGWRGVQRGLPAILIVGPTMAIVQYVVATNGLWNIASACAGLAGLIVGLGVTRLPFYTRVHHVQLVTPEGFVVEQIISTNERGDEESPSPSMGEGFRVREETSRPTPTFPEAIAAYGILVVLAVLIVGVEVVKNLFRWKLGIDIPEVETSSGWITSASPLLGIKIFGHTGAVLLYSSIITFLYYQWRGFYPPNVLPTIISGVRKKGVNPAIGILSMVAMATIMQNAGMTRTLAEWLSNALSADLYAFVATMIGALGAFMTGSNTNSNAVFSNLQMDTAALLGINVALVLGIQNASAALASLLAPAKIMVGASTVGMGGDEGTVLRGLLVYGGFLLLLIATLGFIFIQLGTTF